MQPKHMNAFSMSNPTLKQDPMNAFSQGGLNPSGVPGIFSPSTRRAVQTSVPGMQPPVVFRQERDVAGGGGAPQLRSVEQEPVAQPITPDRKPTEADKVRDREMAKNLTDWSLGGQQTAYTNLEALAGVIRDLESGKANYTGPIIGNNPWRGTFEPASTDAEDRIGRVVQQSLRAILGGNFAKDEADQLIKRSYNVKLDEKYNVARLKLLHDELVRRAQMMDSASSHYNSTGSLMGFEGRMPGMSDFQTLGGEQQARIPQKAPKDLSDDDLLGALGMNK